LKYFRDEILVFAPTVVGFLFSPGPRGAVPEAMLSVHLDLGQLHPLMGLYGLLDAQGQSNPHLSLGRPG
jgi:hypothetical protein